MPFFSRYHTPTSAFPPDVFRLLDELNQATSPELNSKLQGNSRRTFSPNFDIHETNSAYVLEGELPGMHDKSQLNIEFTDNNTLLIRGRIEKSYEKTSPDSSESDAAANGPASSSTPANKADGKKDDQQVAKRPDDSQTAVTKAGDGYRYWVSERTVGEFQRSFSFPGGVDIDGVKANLEHGLLKILVPKKEVVKGRKVEIN